MKKLIFTLVIGLASIATTVSAQAGQRSAREHYDLCVQRGHTGCAERLAIASKYGYWINALGRSRTIPR